MTRQFFERGVLPVGFRYACILLPALQFFQHGSKVHIALGAGYG
jgi:hypothetical protein